MLNEKLDSLVRELNEEAQAILVPEGMVQAAPGDSKDQEKGGSFNPSSVPRIFKSKEQLMLRANSLKKALRQIIEQAEKGEGVARAGSSRDAAAAWHGLRSPRRLVLDPCLGFPVWILGVAAVLCSSLSCLVWPREVPSMGQRCHPGPCLAQAHKADPGRGHRAMGLPGTCCHASLCVQLWMSRTNRHKPTGAAQAPARRTARRNSTRRRRGSVRCQCGMWLFGGPWR